MNDNASSIISKVWSFCNTLRDDGVGYGDYLEQLTYLLFLKLADEFSKPPYNRLLLCRRPTIGRASQLSAVRSWNSITVRCFVSWGSKGHPRADLHEIPEQDPGPGQALTPYRHDRQRTVEHHGDGYQGQDLRRSSGEKRRRY